jgi:hypothetical protein
VTDKVSSNGEHQQRQFLEDLAKIIPQMISELEDGSTLTVTRLGRRRLSDGRIMELRLEAEVIGLGSPGIGHQVKGL